MVFNQYSANYCSGLNNVCSSADLTIAQWNQLYILNNPLVEPPTSAGANDFSYVTYYSGYSTLQYPPEYRFYTAFQITGTGQSPANSYASTAMNTYGFFNMKIWQDLYMGLSDSAITWEQEFIQVAGKSNLAEGYMKYIVLNLGYGGVFHMISPRKLIDGYNCSRLTAMKALPYWLGGNQAVDSYFSIDAPNYFMATNPVGISTGITDDETIRQYNLWNGMAVPTVTTSAYADTNFTSIVTTTASPYPNPLNVSGTDGFQFEAELDSSDNILTVWNAALFRPLNYTQTGMISMYKHINAYTYTLASDAFNANSDFNTIISGTANMTTFATNSLGMFASNAHFYNVSGADSSIPLIVDSAGNAIKANSSDATTFSVNDLSGLTFALNEVMQFNYDIWNDQLVNITGNPGQGLFMPLVYINRGFNLTENQIDNMLSGILSAYKAKWLAFGLIIGFGGGILILGVVLVICARRLKAEHGGAGGDD